MKKYILYKQWLYIVKNVYKWNSQRYEQKYNVMLAQKLLIEEMQELQKAKELAEILDGIGDIVYVIIGIFWKLKIDEKLIAKVFTYYTLQKSYNININLCVNKESLIHYYMTKVVNSINKQYYSLIPYLPKILRIICESNNTKIVPKKLCESYIKANIIKGANYKAPTIELHKLAKKIIKE